jgi:uncharacterized SAM-binding protein YcdF (DUF218 family)
VIECIRRAKCVVCLGVLFLLISAWLIGFLAFINEIPREVQNDVYVADAVVVLTGGSKRLEAGFELLQRGRASVMFISGVSKEVKLRELFFIESGYEQKFLDRIEAGYGAKNTSENAKETASWVSRHGYRSLYLVTASYHMPRSLKEFDRRMSDIEIIPYPVFPDSVRLAGWWRWPGTTALLVGEYVKALTSAFAYFIIPELISGG